MFFWGKEKTVQAQPPVYIIGAGVSGLIAAFELEQTGHRVVVLERSGVVGGRVKTVQAGGFDLDVGFQVLLSAYPLAQRYLDMEALNLRQLASGALVYAGGTAHLIGDPLRDWKALLPTLLAGVGSIGDKLKILKLNKRMKAKSIEAIFMSSETTTQQYLKDFGFSPRIINRFFMPFLSGIFLEPDLRTSSRMFEFVYKMFGEGYATIPEGGIGAISNQLKAKLSRTEFRFNTEVSGVTSDHIQLASGESIPHEGVIIAAPPAPLLEGCKGEPTSWKSCMCVYFEVDRTNIPYETIALLAEPRQLSNNLYAYTDIASGKTVLSVTTLKYAGKPDQEVIGTIEKEIKRFAGVKRATFLHHFLIPQALPDRTDLRMTTAPEDLLVQDKVVLAGDHLLNGSLNAAMESGYLAAQALQQQRQSAPH